MDILFRLSKIRKCTRDVFLNSEESRDRPNYQSNNVPNALAQFASFEELLSVKGIGLQGQVLKNIVKELNDKSKTEKLIITGIPCFNENLSQVMKTQVSLLDNFDFMKNGAIFQDTENGHALQTNIRNTRPVLVYIHDGLYDFKKSKMIMNPQVRDWISESDEVFKTNPIRGLTGNDSDPKLTEISLLNTASDWLVYANMTEWVYHSQIDKTRFVNKKNIQGKTIPFTIIHIIKRKNNSKANSHHWLFNGICNGLTWPEQSPWMYINIYEPLVFLTDCSTVFAQSCLCTLMKELLSCNNLVAVTGRQRLATIGETFHTCDPDEQTYFKCFCGGKKRHTTIKSNPCWRCLLTYLLSPACLQGFEFEATVVLNLGPFNIVETLPVLPGPCQLLKWNIMKKFDVIEKYFELLVSDDAVNDFYLSRRCNVSTTLLDDATSPSTIPSLQFSSLHNKKISPFPIATKDYISLDDLECAVSRSSTSGSSASSMTPFTFSNLHSHGSEGHRLRNIVANTESIDDDNEYINDIESIGILLQDRLVTIKSEDLHIEHGDKNVRNTLRKANMRLAEDRVLSFILAFATGMGTKWVNGATFMYEPEIEFIRLLEQRRRWINGTTACLFFNQYSYVAKTLVDGGSVDKKTKGLVKLMWSINTYQFYCTLIAPAVFGIALYTSLYHDKTIFGYWLGQVTKYEYLHVHDVSYDSTASYIINNVTFSNVTQHLEAVLDSTTIKEYWVNEMPIPGFSVSWAGLIVVMHMAVYIIWVYIAHDHFPTNPETKKKFFNILCPILVCLGFAVALPIYLALINGMTVAVSPVLIMVLITMFGPVLIARSQSQKSAKLYCLYLPWFLVMLVFFLVYIPSYSFARLHDTTWGKGNDREDEAVAKLKEKQKALVGSMNVRLVVFNCLLVWLFCFLPSECRVVFMFLLFLPSFAQILFSMVYIIINFLRQHIFSASSKDRIKSNMPRSRRRSKELPVMTAVATYHT